MRVIRSQFDEDAEDYEEVLPEDEGKAMRYVLTRLMTKQEKAGIKHKGLRGSNTPQESQDFVGGLGDAVDSGPDGGNVPSGGYGDGGGVGASILARIETSSKDRSFSSIVEASISARLENASGWNYQPEDDELTEWQSDLISSAEQDGDKIVLNGKTIWGGLGNRSGLHDYATDLMGEKWKKSGPLFTKRVKALKVGDTVEVFQYRNTSRSTGKWVKLRTMKVKKGDIFGA